MLKIRLARGGAKKRPYYSIVVADSHSPRDGRFIEKVGTYNPLLPKDGPTPRVTLKLESIQAWIAKGARDIGAELLVLNAEAAWKTAPGTPEQRRYTYWLHFAEGSLMPPLLMKLVFDKVREAPVPFFVKPVVRGIADQVTASFIAPNLKRLLAFMEAELASGPWFCGAEFTAADVQMSYPIEAAAERAGLDDRYPKLQEWLARIHAREAYRRALELGGPYSAVP